MKLAEKYKEKPEVCNAIGAHHDEVEMTSLIAPIIQVCDAISGARPGARREVVESYIKRLKEMLLAGGKQSVECLHFVGRTYGGGDAPHGGRMREPQQFVTQLRDGSGAIVRPVHSRCATPRRCVRSS